MGGTFDPVHYGHLVTAETARVEFGLDEVIFVPSGLPPHKWAEAVSDGRHRYLMTVLATATNPRFQVSRIELEREGRSFTVDTMRSLRRSVEEGSRLFFITGADAILEILSWKRPDELLDLCEVIAASRPGFSLSRLNDVLGGLYDRYHNRIHALEVPAVAISSTDVRHRVSTGRPVRYLVPEPVMHYIRKHDLYQGGDAGGDS